MKAFTVFVLFSILSIQSRSQITFNNAFGEVPVLVKVGNKSTGSGFYVRKEGRVFFITAAHVLCPVKNGIVQRTLLANELLLMNYPNGYQNNSEFIIGLRLDSAAKDGRIRIDAEKDVACIFIGSNSFIPNYVRSNTKKSMDFAMMSPNLLAKKNELLLGEQVFVFGFPTLFPKNDRRFSRLKPLLGHGIISGFDNEHEYIVIDCPSYHGESGGPVVVYDSGDRKVKVIGIVTQLVPDRNRSVFVKRGNNYERTDSMMVKATTGFALVVPSDEIINLISHFNHR